MTNTDMDATLVVVTNQLNRAEVAGALSDYVSRFLGSISVSLTRHGFEAKGKRSVLDCVVEEFVSSGMSTKALLMWEK